MPVSRFAQNRQRVCTPPPAAASQATITTVAGTGVAGDGISPTLAQLNFPKGVAVDAAGNLWIADFNNHRIRKVFAATGVIRTVAGDGTQCAPPTSLCGDGTTADLAQLNFPAGVAVNAAGDL